MEHDLNLENVSQFLAREARLLDEGRYRDWLDLFTDDAVYWIPTEESQNLSFEEAGHVANCIYRDKEKLTRFVTGRAESERAWALQGLKTDRLITNLEIRDASRGIVTCKWLLHMEDPDQHLFYLGKSEYHLRQQNGALKIAFKKSVVTSRKTARGHLALI